MTFFTNNSLSRFAPIANAVKRHPLQKILDQDPFESEMQTLRSIQGIHAPLKILSERNAVQRAGGRLPFLPSSNLHLEVLTGDIERIDFGKQFFGKLCIVIN